MSAPFRIAPATSGDDLREARRLFSEYGASLAVDLAYQDFAAELAGLPGRYGPPGGALLLARDEAGVPLGCVALRSSGPAGTAEMKRLYVAPAGRGRGLGRALAEAIVAEAARLGYREIRLDTLPDMEAAQALYRELGFLPVEPYYQTPVDGTIFLALSLPP